MRFRTRQHLAPLLVLLAATLACVRRSPEQRAYVEQMRTWRVQKDDFFRSNASSPLTPEQRADFRGLRYFAPDPRLVPVARLEPSAPDTVRFVTSQNTVDPYVRLGELRFELGGTPASLLLFRSLDGHLFLPFLDATSGEETYPAGRYVEPEPLPDGRYRLDFNRAYNPYCAYNADWTCPLPPPQNQLAMRVQAGEKKFHDE